MTPDNLLILALALPLGGAIVISMLGRAPNLRETATL